MLATGREHATAPIPRRHADCGVPPSAWHPGFWNDAADDMLADGREHATMRGVSVGSSSGCSARSLRISRLGRRAGWRSGLAVGIGLPASEDWPARMRHLACLASVWVIMAGDFSNVTGIVRAGWVVDPFRVGAVFSSELTGGRARHARLTPGYFRAALRAGRRGCGKGFWRVGVRDGIFGRMGFSHERLAASKSRSRQRPAALHSTERRQKRGLEPMRQTRRRPLPYGGGSVFECLLRLQHERE